MKNSLKEDLRDLIPLNGRIKPLTEAEIESLTTRQQKEANAIINDNKKKAFAREYVKTRDAKASAVKVGYASRYGYQLLSNKKVQQYIQEITDLAGTEEIASIQESLMQLTDIIRGEAMDYVVTKDGEIVQIPAQLKDRVKCLDIMTKCQGLQINNHNVNAKVENINVTVDVEQSEIIHEVNPEDVVIIDLDEF